MEENLNTEVNDIITIEEAINDKTKIIINKYIPFSLKQSIVTDVKKSCMEIDNGITKINFGLKKLVKEYLLVLYYSNIDLPFENYGENYDLLKSSGIVQYIIDGMEFEEFQTIEFFVDDELLQEVELNNKFDILINKFLSDGLPQLLQQVLQKLPETKIIDKWVKNMVKTVSNLDPKKYEKLNELMDYAKGDKKTKEE